MATSGVSTFNVTGNDIVEKALAIVTVRDAEIAFYNNELSDGLQTLNIYMKYLMSQGLHLWTRTEGVLFLDAGITSYMAGPSGAECCLASDFVQTAMSTAAVVTATTLVVDSTTGMTAGDYIGIKLDDQTRQWTTIVSVDSAVGLTITAALTDASAIDNSVFTFTTLIERPLRIESARRSSLTSNTEIELTKWSRQQYFAQTDKTSQGVPTSFYYDPQLVDGEIHIWQTASSVDQLVRFTFQRSIEDIVTSGNNPDFPVEWAQPLIWGLAALIGHEYEVSLPKMQMIEQKAQIMEQEILGWDQEITSLNIKPNFRGV